MEQLDVFDCSNVLIASYFADDRECAHENREHTLIYQCSGRLEIEERGKKTVLYPGDCAFMRRDNRMWLQKRVGKGEPYRSIVLKFSKAFLREFYQQRRAEQAEKSRAERRKPVSIFYVKSGFALKIFVKNDVRISCSAKVY